MAATASVDEASTKWVAPNWRARPSLEARVSTAMIRLAPASRRPWITLSPTPPTPNTAAVSPACTLARLSTEPTPVRTPHPMRQAEVMGTSLEILTAWTSFTMVDSANTEVPAKFEAGSPLKVKGWDTLPRVLTHQVGWPVLQARQVAAALAGWR